MAVVCRTGKDLFGGILICMKQRSLPSKPFLSMASLSTQGSLGYKNIVQQFSCHSKHSYLSVNGPHHISSHRKYRCIYTQTKQQQQTMYKGRKGNRLIHELFLHKGYTSVMNTQKLLMTAEDGCH